MILKTEITPNLLSKLSIELNIKYIVVPTKGLLIEILNNKQIQNWYDMQTHNEILIGSGIIGYILQIAIVLKKTPSNCCEAFINTQEIDTYENIDNIKQIADEISIYWLKMCEMGN